MSDRSWGCSLGHLMGSSGDDGHTMQDVVDLRFHHAVDVVRAFNKLTNEQRAQISPEDLETVQDAIKYAADYREGKLNVPDNR